MIEELTECLGGGSPEALPHSVVHHSISFLNLELGVLPFFPLVTRGYCGCDCTTSIAVRCVHQGPVNLQKLLVDFIAESAVFFL